MFCDNILKALSSSDVKYLIVGGVAVNLYGFARLTGDLDVMLLMEDANIAKFIRILKKLNFKPKLPVSFDDFMNREIRDSWIKEKGMKAFSVYCKDDPGEVVDILIDSCLDFKSAYSRKKIMKSGKFSLSVISLNDLIGMKTKADRDRDRLDISVLNKIKRINNGAAKK